MPQMNFVKSKNVIRALKPLGSRIWQKEIEITGEILYRNLTPCQELLPKKVLSCFGLALLTGDCQKNLAS